MKDKATDRKGPRYHSNKKELWNRKKREEQGVEMPTLPGPTLTGMRTVIGKAGGYDDMYLTNDDLVLPPTVGEIAVTRDADNKMVCNSIGCRLGDSVFQALGVIADWRRGNPTKMEYSSKPKIGYDYQ